MSNDTITDSTARELPEPAPHPTGKPRNRRGLAIGAIAAPLALGVVGFSLAQPSQGVAPTSVAPTSISAFVPSGAIAAKGEVAEIFGNKFVIDDGTGRALVETGREGEDGKLVIKGETITVQGRFENGFLHAKLITRADGKQIALGRSGGPPMGTADWAKDKIGLAPKPDQPALTEAVEKAGYGDVRVTGRGPRHLEVAARGPDGTERMLHVDFDGRIRERALR